MPQDCSSGVTNQELVDFFHDRNPQLLRYLFWQVNCRDIAEELAQETYARFLTHEGPRSIADLNAFLFTIAANLARDHLRSVSRRQDHDYLPLDEELADPGPSTEDLVATHCLEQRLERAIEDLPGKTREVFLLYRVDGLKYREIADRLDISERTVEYHLRQAMIKCRHCLTLDAEHEK